MQRRRRALRGCRGRGGGGRQGKRPGAAPRLPGAGGGAVPGSPAAELLRRLDRPRAGTPRAALRDRRRPRSCACSRSSASTRARSPTFATGCSTTPSTRRPTAGSCACWRWPAIAPRRSRRTAAAPRRCAASWRPSRAPRRSAPTRGFATPSLVREPGGEPGRSARGPGGPLARRPAGGVGGAARGVGAGRPGQGLVRARHRGRRHRQVAPGRGAADLGPAPGGRRGEDALVRRGGPAVSRAGERVAAQRGGLPAPRPARGRVAGRGRADPARAARRAPGPAASRAHDGVRRPPALLRGPGPGGARGPTAAAAADRRPAVVRPGDDRVAALPAPGSIPRRACSSSPRRARSSSTLRTRCRRCCGSCGAPRQLSEIALEPLDAAETAALATQVASRAFDARRGHAALP